MLTEIFNGRTVWECACGNGNIVKAMKEYFRNNTNVYIEKYLASDIAYRGYGCVLDFLESDARADVIITNPPFALMNEFMQHGLKQTRRYLIFFAKIQLLKTKSRAEILKNSPLHRKQQDKQHKVADGMGEGQTFQFLRKTRKRFQRSRYGVKKQGPKRLHAENENMRRQRTLDDVP